MNANQTHPIQGGERQAERGMPVRQVRVRRFGTESAVIERLTFVQCTIPRRALKRGHDGPYEDCQDLSRVSRIDCDLPQQSNQPPESMHRSWPGCVAAGDAEVTVAGAGLVIRWLIVGLGLLAIGAALGNFVAGDRIVPADLEAILLVQHLGWAGLNDVAWVVSRTGDALPSLLVISLLAAVFCAMRGRSDLAILVASASLARGLGPPLKWHYASPRPPVELVTVFELTDGFGYPSGHAFGAALVYGAIALFGSRAVQRSGLRNLVRVVSMLMVVLIALSRVRLGVHWFSDVAGGLLFGIGILCELQAMLLFMRERRLRI